MTASLHPAGYHDLPGFVPPGETDVLMIAIAVLLLIAVPAFGSLALFGGLDLNQS
jgi:hypothetical protein